MADETKTSLMMKFDQGGVSIEAECPLDISAADLLATSASTVLVKPKTIVAVPGFKRAGLDQVHRYFLIKSFGFSAALSDSEARQKGAGAQNQAGSQSGGQGGGGKNAAPALGGQHRHGAGGLGLGHTGGPGNGRASSGSGDQFARWRSATDNSWNKDGVFASHIDDFHFTRFVDSATNALFTACCKGTTFTSASLIKRKAARVLNSETLVDLAFLRIDFAGVKITELSWSDGDILEETCKFTCDGMQITYSQQQASGKLSPAEPPVGWSNPMTQTTGRGAGSS